MAKVTKHRGLWVIDYRDSAKKRRVLRKDPNTGLRFEKKKEAEDVLAKIVNNGRREQVKKTFREYGEWWLEHCAKDQIKESTFEEYSSVLANHLYPVFGDMLMGEIRRSDVREFITLEKKSGRRISELRRLEGLRDRLSFDAKDNKPAEKKLRRVKAQLARMAEAPRKPLAGSTLRNILAPARSMYSGLIEDEILDFNPFAGVGKKLNKKKSSDPDDVEQVQESQIHDIGQVAKALDKAAEIKPRYHPVFACGYLSGLRMGEVIALRSMDVDFEAHVIHVRQNFYRGRLTTPKGNRRRDVDIEAELEEILRALITAKIVARKQDALQLELLKPAEQRLHRREEIVEEATREVMEGFIFRTENGAPLDPSNLRRVFHSVLEAAGLPRIRYHDMRHTYASNLLKARVEVAEVSKLLGHSSTKVTHEIYTHFIPEEKKERVSVLSDAMAAARQQRA